MILKNCEIWINDTCQLKCPFTLSRQFSNACHINCAQIEECNNAKKNEKTFWLKCCDRKITVITD